MAIRAYLAVCVLLCGGLALAQEQPAELYYQVSYRDGTIRDLSDPPDTDAGIDRVTRFVRYQQGARGYEVLATGPAPLTHVGGSRVVRTQMRWNGSAWVAPQQAGSPSAAGALAGANGRAEDKLAPLAAELKRLDIVLKALDGQLARLDHLVAQAQRDRASEDPNSPAVAKLAKLQQKRDIVLEAIKQYRVQQAAVRDAAGTDANSPSTVGAINKEVATDAGGAAIGIVQPISGKRVLSHRMHVWKLPAGTGSRTYAVSAAHGEAGALGAFNYVAYADTDGDHKPDKLIAMSPLATGEATGQWTSWRFTTDSETVFVGQCWPESDTALYCQPAEDTDRNWRGLPREIYVSGFYGGMPTTHKLWPYLTNIRVRLDR